MNNLCLLSMGRTKKLFYVPGLISLVGIFIALPSFHQKNKPTKENCLTLFIPSDGRKDHSMEYPFSSCYFERVINKKKKIQFTLNEDGEENKIKMSLIRYEALKLKYTEDTSTVILITLSDSISYGELISLYDMCGYDKHTRYASWDNKFVIFGEPPPKKKETSNSLKSWGSDLVIVPKPVIKPTLFELLKTKINKYYTPRGMYLLLGWIAVLISFLYFRKRKSVLQKH
jgi:hypothetical protein